MCCGSRLQSVKMHSFNINLLFLFPEEQGSQSVLCAGFCTQNLFLPGFIQIRGCSIQVLLPEHTGRVPFGHASLCWKGGRAMPGLAFTQLRWREMNLHRWVTASVQNPAQGWGCTRCSSWRESRTQMVIIWEYKLGLWGNREEIQFSKIVGQFKICNFILLWA